MKNKPIPGLTVDLIEWLDARYPEQSPRFADDVPASLRRGAIRMLIDDLRQEVSQANAYEDDDNVSVT